MKKKKDSIYQVNEQIFQFPGQKERCEHDIYLLACEKARRTLGCVFPQRIIIHLTLLYK